jgi:hypothetical protein
MCAWRGHEPGSRTVKRGGLLAVLLAVGFIEHPAPVSAQQTAYAAQPPAADSAQSLAQHALDCLRRGEDAISTESRLVAYREGLQFAERAVATDDQNATAHFAVFANNGRILLLEGVTANPFTLASVNHELDRALELDPNESDALAA